MQISEPSPTIIDLVSDKPKLDSKIKDMRRPSSRKDVEFDKLGWLKDHFRYLDMFGTTVNFTYDSDEVYKTHEGASVTVLIIITLLIVTGTQLKNMLSGSEKLLISSIKYNDLNNDIEPFTFQNRLTVHQNTSENNWFSLF